MGCVPNGADDVTRSSDPPGEPFVAEFTLSSPDIESLAELVPDAELRMVDYYRDEAGRERGVFWVVTGDYDAFDDALSGSRIIDAWECVVEATDRRLYAIALSRSGELAGTIDLSRAHGIVWQVVAAHHGRLFVRAIVPDRTALSAFHEGVAARGYDFRLERVVTNLVPTLSRGTSLTVRQREAIVLAYERGYYRQPREVTLAELGEELGISESAVSGRLHRGLDRLIADCLDVHGAPDGSTDAL